MSDAPISHFTAGVIAGFIPVEGKKYLLGAFFRMTEPQDSTTKVELRPRTEFIETVVNKGIESLPPDQQALLVEHAPDLAALVRSRESRRHFIKQMGKVGLGLPMTAVGLTDTAYEGWEGKKGEAEVSAAITAGTAAYAAADMAKRRCDAIFQRKLSAWLKKEYNLDFPSGDKSLLPGK